MTVCTPRRGRTTTGGAASRPRSSRPRRRWQARMAARAAAAWSSGMGAPFLPARATPEAALAGVGGDVDGDTKIPAGRACATSARCGQRGGGPTSSQLSRGSQRRQATPIGIRSAFAMLAKVARRCTLRFGLRGPGGLCASVCDVLCSTVLNCPEKGGAWWGVATASGVSGRRPKLADLADPRCRTVRDGCKPLHAHSSCLGTTAFGQHRKHRLRSGG